MYPALKALLLTALSMPFAAILWQVTFVAGAQAHEIALSLGYRGDSAEAAAILAGVMMFFSLLAFGIAGACCLWIDPKTKADEEGADEE